MDFIPSTYFTVFQTRETLCTLLLGWFCQMGGAAMLAQGALFRMPHRRQVQNNFFRFTIFRTFFNALSCFSSRRACYFAFFSSYLIFSVNVGIVFECNFRFVRCLPQWARAASIHIFILKREYPGSDITRRHRQKSRARRTCVWKWNSSCEQILHNFLFFSVVVVGADVPLQTAHEKS